MPEQYLPNYFADGIRALHLGEADRNRNAFRQLAQNAWGAQGDARNAFVQRAVGIDPEAGAALDKTLQGQENAQLRKLKGAITYIEDAQRANQPERVQAAWNQIRPWLARSHPDAPPPPENFSDAEPMFNEARARIAMLDAGDPSSIPSGFRETDMQLRAAGYQPGSPEYQRGMKIATGIEGRAVNAAAKSITVDIDGVPTTLTFDPATRSYTPAVLGQGAPVQMPQGMTQVQYATSDGSPIPDEEQAIAAQAMAAAARGEHVDLPVAGAVGQPMSVPIVGRRKEDEARAVRSAEAGVDLAFKPTTEGAITRARTEAELGYAPQRAAAEAATASAVGEAKLGVEARQSARDALPSLREQMLQLRRVQEGFKRGRYSTGAENALIPDSLQSDANQVLATDVNAMILDLAANMKGTLSDKDVAFLRSASIDLNKSEEANAQIVRQVMERVQRAINANEAKAQGTQAARGGDGSPRVTSRAQFDALPSGAIYIGTDGRRYRKP